MNKAHSSYFITVEGIDGVGKSSCMEYLATYLQQHQIPYVLTREPGGTPIAEEIRTLLKHHIEPMTVETELLLIFAARSQHLAHKIKPALTRGEWVICDRFTDASYAYQGGGRGIEVSKIAQLENFIQDEFRPDLVILLVAPVKIALARAKHRGQADRFEREEEHFFEQVQAAYLARAKLFPERYRVLDANCDPSQVKQQVFDTIAAFHEKNA